MPEYPSSGQAANQAYYISSEAVATYSFYTLLKEEDYLFPKYFKAGESVLDLACGMARTTLLLHKMGMRVCGIDRSEKFIEVAKQRFPDLDLRVGSFDAIGAEDASFDNIVIALNGIDLAIPESQRVAALRECTRVLKPGGILIFSSHNLKSLHWFSPYYNRHPRWKLRNCLRAFRKPSYLWEGEQCLMYTTPEYAVGQAESAGLELLEICGFNRFRSSRIDRYFSPYLHYVFTKPRQ